MPTKVTGEKPEEESEVKRIRRSKIASMTPKKIDNYIDNNVTDLESAKDVLKILAKMVSVLMKERE